MEISTIMMIVFIIALIISIWKIYVFLPDERLADDDTNAASIAELEALMLSCITKPTMSEKELFHAIKTHEKFDAKHYWRFNENRLKHLLHDYCVKNRPLRNIEDIYQLNISKK